MVLLLPILFVLFSSITLQAQWEQTNGPSNIGISSLVFSDTILIAGTTWDGVYRSTNNAVMWNPVNMGLTSHRVYSVAVSSGTSRTMYAGTDGGLFLSTDDGTTWIASSSVLGNIPVQTIVINSEKPEQVFVGTRGYGAYYFQQ